MCNITNALANNIQVELLIHCLCSWLCKQLNDGLALVAKNSRSTEVVDRYVVVRFAVSQEGEKHSLVKSQGTSFTSSSSNARFRYAS